MEAQTQALGQEYGCFGSYQYCRPIRWISRSSCKKFHVHSFEIELTYESRANQKVVYYLIRNLQTSLEFPSEVRCLQVAQERR